MISDCNNILFVFNVVSEELRTDVNVLYYNRLVTNIWPRHKEPIDV